jgi:hypothetical protein
MRARLRVIPAAVALATGFAAPALAQDAQTPPQPIAATPAPSSDEAVGPAQLRDFSLQGTVTRRAETPPQPEPRAPVAREQAPTPAQPSTAAPVGATERAARVATHPTTVTPTPAQIASTPTGLPTPEQTLKFSPATITPEPPITGTTPLVSGSPDVGGGFITYWPWLLALLAAIGAAVWYFRRQRSGYAFAGADADASAFDLAPPPPAPPPPRAQPRAQAPQPAPTPPAPRVPLQNEPLTGLVTTRLRAAPEVEPEVKPAPALPGIVSTRLRPWLDIEFAPLTASFDEQSGVINFDVTLFNSGSAPARDVLLEARLFNAGDDQDEVIAKFFDNPAVYGERIEAVEPLKRMAFRTSATVPREQMRIFEAGGRKVWVPLIGFNACYRWGGGEGQTSASYLLGRNSNGGKMAPFRVDMGMRTFNGLDAREHHVRVRR